MTSHYLSEEHQYAIIKMIKMFLSNGIDKSFASQYDNFPIVPEKLRDTISTLFEEIQTLKDVTKSFNDESHPTHKFIDEMMENLSSIILKITNKRISLNEIEVELATLRQIFSSVKQNLISQQTVPYNGFYIWEITGCQEKLSKKLVNKVSVKKY